MKVFDKFVKFFRISLRSSRFDRWNFTTSWNCTAGALHTKHETMQCNYNAHPKCASHLRTLLDVVLLLLLSPLVMIFLLVLLLLLLLLLVLWLSSSSSLYCCCRRTDVVVVGTVVVVVLLLLLLLLLLFDRKPSN